MPMTQGYDIPNAQAWVRRRIAQAGLPRPAAVHVVSSVKGAGVQALLETLHDAVEPHGDVWVVRIALLPQFVIWSRAALL